MANSTAAIPRRSFATAFQEIPNRRSTAPIPSILRMSALDQRCAKPDGPRSGILAMDCKSAAAGEIDRVADDLGAIGRGASSAGPLDRTGRKIHGARQHLRHAAIELLGRAH